MAEVPYDWAEYARCQQQLSTRAQIDDAAWGLEAGLNSILERKSASEEATETETIRTIATASRRNRYRTNLLKRHTAYFADENNVSALLHYEARSDLAKLAFSLSFESYQLLISIGQREERCELAAKFGLSDAALRARISRARFDARKMLAI